MDPVIMTTAVLNIKKRRCVWVHPTLKRRKALGDYKLLLFFLFLLLSYPNYDKFL